MRLCILIFRLCILRDAAWFLGASCPQATLPNYCFSRGNEDNWVSTLTTCILSPKQLLRTFVPKISQVRVVFFLTLTACRKWYWRLYWKRKKKNRAGVTKLVLKIRRITNHGISRISSQSRRFWPDSLLSTYMCLDLWKQYYRTETRVLSGLFFSRQKKKAKIKRKVSPFFLPRPVPVYLPFIAFLSLFCPFSFTWLGGGLKRVVKSRWNMGVRVQIL